MITLLVILAVFFACMFAIYDMTKHTVNAFRSARKDLKIRVELSKKRRTK